ncbi:hypothetical protein [Streptomonospora alba]|uniref:hypothetical protein n=1 Tax=Streptomonospora alba TaxID=183763 RepID=UPI000699E187|nr:hypothetical protein [Streptomonospora alba]
MRTRHRARLVLSAAALVVLAPVAALVGPAVGAAPADAAVAAAAPPEPAPGAEPEPPEPSAPSSPPEASPAPSPAPGVEPGPPEDTGSSGDGEGQEGPPTGQECGAFDYACKVTEALNTWLISTVTDMANAGLVTAAVGMISTPPPTSGIEDAWRISQQVTSTVYVLVVTVAGVLVMTNPSVQTSAGLKEVLPRLLLGFIGANASWFLCSLMADVGNGAALGLVSETANPESVAHAVGRVIANPEGELFIIVLLFLVANLLAVFLYFAVLIRIVLWLLLTAIAPIALACHALPQTDGLARLWWRAMSALLIIQVAQALVLRIAVTVFLNREQMQTLDPGGTVGSLADVALLICCLYVLVRIPYWAFKQVFNLQASPVVKGAKLAVSLLVFRNIGRAVAAARGGASAGGTGGSGLRGRGAPRGGGGGPNAGGPGRGRAASGGSGAQSGSSRPAGAPGSRGTQAQPGGAAGTGGARRRSGTGNAAGPLRGTVHPPGGNGRQQNRPRGGPGASPARSSAAGGTAGGSRPGAGPGSGAGDTTTDGRGPRQGPGSASAGPGRAYSGGIRAHRPRPPGPHPPPPDPARYRPIRPENVRLPPQQPPRGRRSRPVRPRPRPSRRNNEAGDD